MARRALPTITTAFTVAAALLLAGCGGGDDASSGGIEGADTGSGSPSASASANSSGPDVSLSKDLKLDFDFAKPSDAKHAAALTSAENYLRALNHGFIKQDPDDPAYQYYSSGQAADYAKQQIQSWVKGGWTPVGTDKYYDEDITDLSSQRILVTFCRNQEKFYGKEIKTGKVLYTGKSLINYQKFSLAMGPASGSGSSQVWKTQIIQVQGKVKECQR
ncbi:hypothetical protein [Streptomyces sp. NPDC094437]|uniref:hypothetical protein n=1 Tax=Streptomyces sp. NPDC094437 TaxID=3366060 RepID=UPI0038218461